jgi:trimeric autotransporter adhesin
MSFRTNALKVQAFAGAVYGIQVGTTTMAQINADITSAGGLTNALNGYYTSSFGSVANATVATAIATNLGLTGDALTSGAAYVEAQLNAAAAGARGAVISNILDLFAGLASDATFGAAATAWNTKVDSATAYTGATNVAIGSTVGVGTAFTLTTNIETINGGAGDDVISGAIVYSAGAEDGSTLNSGDSIVGGAGTDTLRIAISGSNVAADTHTPMLSGIERILVASNETDATDNLTIDLANADSSLTTIGTYASTADGDLTFSNVAKIVDIQVTGKGDLAVTYASGVTSGSADSQTITLAGAGTSNTARSEITSAGIETVNLVSAGSTNNITLTNSSLKTLNITGDKALTIGQASTALTTIDASAATGAITIDSLGGSNLTLTGGSGNDTLRIDGSTVDANDSINAGEGIDTLALTVATNIGSAAVGAKVAGFERVFGYRNIDGDPANLTVSQNVSFISGVTTVGTNSWTVSDETVEADAELSDGVSFSGLTATVTDMSLSGISYTTSDAEGGFAFTATVTMGADTTADALNVTLGTTTAAAFTATAPDGAALNISATDYENLTINSQGGANTIATLTAGDLSKLTVNASKALTISSIASVTSAFRTIDASASTADVRIDTAIQAAGTVLGGAGNDTMTGSAFADSIDGGAGNDSLVSGGGNDTINGGAGNDTITNGSSTSTNRVLIDAGAGDDTIIAGTGNDTMLGGEGNDIFEFAWATSSVEADDSVSSFAVLTSADVVNGGDGTDTLRVTGTVLDNDTLDLSGSSLTAFSGVTGVERLQWNGANTEDDDTITIKLGDIAMGSFNNDLTVTFGTAVDYAAGVNASSVFNSSSKVTASAASGQVFTYTLGNGTDIATGGTAADTFVVSNNVFWGTNDVLKGGAGNDTLSFTDDAGGTLTAKLATLSSIETISINTTDTADARVVVVLNDSIIANNYDSAGNKFTITRHSADDGALSVDGSSVSATYNLVLTGAEGAIASTGGGDTLIGGAGNDTITGGAGNPDVITLTAGGTDSIRFTAGTDGGASVDIVTGFTTYTSSGTSTAAQTGYDLFVFTAERATAEAEVFDAATGILFGDTDPTTTVGAVVALAAADYNEFAGSSSAAGTGLADDHVNVITGRGYSSFQEAIDFNGVAADNGEDVTPETGTDFAMVVVFYNTSTARTEMWYTPDADADDEDSGFTVSNAVLLAYSTDITLTGIGGFSHQNFAVESIG